MILDLVKAETFMIKTQAYLQALIGLGFLLTAMAIHSNLRGAPIDLQQGENARILYVHVPAARISILLYLVAATQTLGFLVTKHPFCLRASTTALQVGTLFTALTLVTGAFRGKPMWGTYWVWDARLTSVVILFGIYLAALAFQKVSVELSSIFICIGSLDIPIIKFSVNWWNTLHQAGSISRFGTSIHLSMLLPIFVNFANLLVTVAIAFILETRLSLLTFRKSTLIEALEEREFSRE